MHLIYYHSFNKLRWILLVCPNDDIIAFIYSVFFPHLQPKIVEENLTYAELDLVRPIPDAGAKHSGTVYAQILFEEQQLWDQTSFLFC